MSNFDYEVRGHDLSYSGFADGTGSQFALAFSIAAETMSGRRVMGTYYFYEGEPDRVSQEIDDGVMSGTEQIGSQIATGRRGHFDHLRTTRAVTDVIQWKAPTQLTVAVDNKARLAFATLRARQRGYILTIKCSLKLEKHYGAIHATGVTYGGGSPAQNVWGDPWKVKI